MIPTRITFKSPTISGGILATLATKVLGAQRIMNDPGMILYQLHDGTLIECHGAGGFHYDNLFNAGNTVISFKVEDIARSVQALMESGAVLIDEINRLCPTYAYCHLQLSDNLIIGLHQEGLTT